MLNDFQFVKEGCYLWIWLWTIDFSQANGNKTI